MSDFKKKWKPNDIYNFNVELNRIEFYNKYVENWLKTYYGVEGSLIHKIDWTINDIVDLKDINRIKNNINNLLNILGSSTSLTIVNQINQAWTSEKANEIENALREFISILGVLQFRDNITGLTISGQNLKLNMGV